MVVVTQIMVVMLVFTLCSIFGLFKHLFDKHNCEIVVMSEVGSVKLDNEEIFEEIISLLHCYSMKLYTKRRVKQKIKEAVMDVGDADTADDS